MPPPAKTPTGLWLLIALLALGAGGKAILHDTLDPDCFWHLRVADQLCHDGVRSLVDGISFASVKEPWTPYSWLAELGMKALWDAGGYRAAILAQAAMSALFVLAIALIARTGETHRRGDAARVSALAVVIATAFAAFLCMAYLSFRPATLAILLLSFCYLLLQRDAGKNQQTRSIWLIVPLTALLANIHLYVFLVPLWLAAILIGERLAGRSTRRLVFLLLATSLASLATPMLPGMIRTLLHYQFNDPMVAGPAISEMQPFWRGAMGQISAVGVLGFFVAIVLRRRQFGVADWLLLIGSTLLLLIHGRYAPLFAIVAAPLLARMLPTFSSAPLARPLLVRALAAILLVGVARLSFAFPSKSTNVSQWLNRHGPDAPGYPASAADFIETRLPARTGRLINEFTWGGYLAWRLGDRYQVLLDGRTQLFSSHFWQATYLGTPVELQTYLSSVPADAALLPAGHSRFRYALLKLGWQTVYNDDRAEVLIPPAALSTLGF